jgi:hypothetical protein
MHCAIKFIGRWYSHIQLFIYHPQLGWFQCEYVPADQLVGTDCARLVPTPGGDVAAWAVSSCIDRLQAGSTDHGWLVQVVQSAFIFPKIYKKNHRKF